MLERLRRKEVRRTVIKLWSHYGTVWLIVNEVGNKRMKTVCTDIKNGKMTTIVVVKIPIIANVFGRNSKVSEGTVFGFVVGNRH